MSNRKHPCGPSLAGYFASEVLDRHHSFTPGPDGQCIECEWIEQNEKLRLAERIKCSHNREHHRDRRVIVLAMAVWILMLAVAIAFLMWVDKIS